MLKQIAWNTFKNTGNINTFMELKEVDKAIENANNEQKNETFEQDKNKDFNKINL